MSPQITGLGEVAPESPQDETREDERAVFETQEVIEGEDKGYEAAYEPEEAVESSGTYEQAETIEQAFVDLIDSQETVLDVEEPGGDDGSGESVEGGEDRFMPGPQATSEEILGEREEQVVEPASDVEGRLGEALEQDDHPGDSYEAVEEPPKQGESRDIGIQPDVEVVDLDQGIPDDMDLGDIDPRTDEVVSEIGIEQPGEEISEPFDAELDEVAEKFDALDREILGESEEQGAILPDQQVGENPFLPDEGKYGEMDVLELDVEDPFSEEIDLEGMQLPEAEQFDNFDSLMEQNKGALDSESPWEDPTVMSSAEISNGAGPYDLDGKICTPDGVPEDAIIRPKEDSFRVTLGKTWAKIHEVFGSEPSKDDQSTTPAVAGVRGYDVGVPFAYGSEIPDLTPSYAETEPIIDAPGADTMTQPAGDEPESWQTDGEPVDFEEGMDPSFDPYARYSEPPERRKDVDMEDIKDPDWTLVDPQGEDGAGGPSLDLEEEKPDVPKLDPKEYE